MSRLLQSTLRRAQTGAQLTWTLHPRAPAQSPFRCYVASRDASRTDCLKDTEASPSPTSPSQHFRDPTSRSTHWTAGSIGFNRPQLSALLNVEPVEDETSQVKVRGTETDCFEVQGRVTAMRRHGAKLLFLDIVGDFEKLQVMVNFNTLRDRSPDQWSDAAAVENFRQEVDKIQRGDFVHIGGHMSRTKTGALTLRAHQMPLVVSKPAHLLPQSITDDEDKAHSRHLDLFLNQRSVDNLRVRAQVIKSIRHVLDARNFTEVQTPLLAGAAGGATARPFVTQATEFGASQPLALRIAPELWLKRLVAGGMDRVYEIGACFRNEGLDTTHNPEFTMCEFYEAWARLDHLMRTTERLMKVIATDLQERNTEGIRQGRRPLDLPDMDRIAERFYDEGKTPQVDFVTTLEKALGFKLPDLESTTALADLTAQLRERGQDDDLLGGGTQDQDDGTTTLTLSKLLDRLGTRYVEDPSTADGGAVFITSHPACMAPLARSKTCPATGQKVAIRAEYFVDGVEIANMYEEEHDAAEQERKFAAAAAQRLVRRAGGETEPAAVSISDDEASYVEALRAGMPPTGGWGCGMDRLAMLFAGAPRIRDVLTFGNLRNVLSASRPLARKRTDAGTEQEA